MKDCEKKKKWLASFNKPLHKGDLAALPSFPTVRNPNNETKGKRKRELRFLSPRSLVNAPRFRDVSAESFGRTLRIQCYPSLPFDSNCTFDTHGPGGICISRSEGPGDAIEVQRERGVEELKWNENASIWSPDVWSTDEWVKLTLCTNDVNTVLHDRRLVNNSGEREKERTISSFASSLSLERNSPKAVL